MGFQSQLRPSILFFRGIIALSFAAFCLLSLPRPGALFFTVLSSAFLLADSAAALFLRNPESSTLHPFFGWPALTAMIGIATAAFLFLSPSPTTIKAGMALGAWAFFTGAIHVTGALQSRPDPTVSARCRHILGLSGAISMILGTLLFFQPWSAFGTLITLLAAHCLVIAAASISLGFGIRAFLLQSTPPVNHQESFRRSA